MEEGQEFAKKTLVIARRRGFWASGVFTQNFPLRLLLRSNPSVLEQVAIAVLGLVAVALLRPQALILGTSTRIVFWYARLKRWGLFKRVCVITDCQYLPTKIVRFLDKLIVYSRGEIDQYPDDLKNKFVFMPYPSKTEKVAHGMVDGEYIFCGGNNDRDHASFLEAVRTLSVKVVVVTDRKLPKDIPANCIVYGHLPLADYMGIMSKSLFVVVPLNPSKLPHGHCDISSAFGLGKVVISTHMASVDDYVNDGVDGLLVPPGDIQDYRHAILSLLQNRALLQKMEKASKEKGRDLSYDAFAVRLKRLASIN